MPSGPNQPALLQHQHTYNCPLTSYLPDKPFHSFSPIMQVLENCTNPLDPHGLEKIARQTIMEIKCDWEMCNIIFNCWDSVVKVCASLEKLSVDNFQFWSQYWFGQKSMLHFWSFLLHCMNHWHNLYWLLSVSMLWSTVKPRYDCISITFGLKLTLN